MNQLRYVLLAVTLIALVGVSALALNVPNTFVSGEVISAAEMNANFAAVAASVSALEAEVAALEAIQPVVAHARAPVTFFSVNSTAVAQDVVVASLAAPAAGVVIVTATAQARFAGTTLANRFMFAIDDVAGGVLSGDDAGTFMVGSLEPPNTAITWSPVAIQRAFEVEAGVHEFRLEAQASDANGTKYLWSSTITATWYPADSVALSSAITTSSFGGDNLR